MDIRLFKHKKKPHDNKIIDNTYASEFKFFNWMQEFTKKIVIITTILFILIVVICVVMIIISYFQTGELNMDTIISESNQTFRDIIGGYIVKSATENVSKSVALIMDRYFEYKAKVLNLIPKDEDSSSDSATADNSDLSDDPQSPENENLGEESDEEPENSTIDKDENKHHKKGVIFNG